MYSESMTISEILVASEGAKDSLKFMGIGFGIGVSWCQGGNIAMALPGAVLSMVLTFFGIPKRFMEFKHCQQLQKGY